VPEIEAALAGWESFYVIVGTSAAALTGLTFVVIAMIAEAGPRSAGPEGIATFITPTIFHFCVALLISGLISAPWRHELVSLSVALGLTALCGLGYTLIVLRRSRRVERYQFVLEDWMWHTVFPFVAYIAIAVAAILMRQQLVFALFIVGASALFLLFIGIHNAWDTVTYVTVARLERERAKDEGGSATSDQ
jgi:hypothetical protein